MATMNISLPDQMKAWVEAQTKTGDYANASDYVRDLIRRDRERRQADTELQAIVTQGLNSGIADPVDRKKFIASLEAASVDA